MIKKLREKDKSSSTALLEGMMMLLFAVLAFVFFLWGTPVSQGMVISVKLTPFWTKLSLYLNHAKLSQYDSEAPIQICILVLDIVKQKYFTWDLQQDKNNPRDLSNSGRGQWIAMHDRGINFDNYTQQYKVDPDRLRLKSKVIWLMWTLTNSSELKFDFQDLYTLENSCKRLYRITYTVR